MDASTMLSVVLAFGVTAACGAVAWAWHIEGRVSTIEGKLDVMMQFFKIDPPKREREVKKK
jgi:hypothetical protein